MLSTPRRNAAVAAFVVAATVAVVWAAYLAVAVPARWFSSAPERTWSGPALNLANGSTGAYVGGGLVVTAPDASGTVLVSVNTDFASSEYPGVAWSVQGIPLDADVRLVWRTDVATRRTNIASVAVEGGQARPLVLNRDPAWVGRVKGLALAIRLPTNAPLALPLRVDGVTATPMTAFAVVRDRIREWYTFEGFTGTSINTVTGGADSQNLPLPALAATIVALAALALALVHRVAPRRYGVGAATTIGALFVVAWLAVDARWAWNLALQTRETAERYGGKDNDERHRVAEDADLFAFIEKARAVMPRKPVNVFVAASEHYFRGRAAYHLYPNNVQFEAFRDMLAPSWYMHPGDWILVYHRGGILYDEAQKTLRWDGGPPVNVDLKLADPAGAALFQLR